MVRAPTDDREAVLDVVVERARKDRRVDAAVLVGSLGRGEGDRWSDLDLALVVAPGVDCPTVAASFVGELYGELDVVHRYEVSFDTCLVRGLFLSSGLLLDLSFTPADDFTMWAPGRVLFDRTGRVARVADELIALRVEPDWAGAAGLAWHDILHGAAAIGRGEPWRAHFYLERVRTRTLRLACERHGGDADELAGVDELPPDELAALLPTLVPVLDTSYLSIALRAAAAAFMGELHHGDPVLAARIEGPLLAAAAGHADGRRHSPCDSSSTSTNLRRS